MKPKLVIWGASHHAMVVADIIRLCGEKPGSACGVGPTYAK